MTTERFVSLHGFFAFQYPKHWTTEIDDAGNYLFYDDKAGSGVLRVLLLENEGKEEDAAGHYLNKIAEDFSDFDPVDSQMGENRVVHYVQLHEVNHTEFTVYYWITAYTDKVVLFTYTVQSTMKHLPTAEQEKKQVNELIQTLEFLKEVKSAK